MSLRARRVGEFKRIHVFGASGSGSSTLGRALAEAHGLRSFESDDFFWETTDPPYQRARPRAERQRMLLEALNQTPHWVLAGSMVGWGDAAVSLVELAVFITTSTDLRLRRLQAREAARFGARILEGGDMYAPHQEFLRWASQYDHGPVQTRSRRLHEEWLSRLECPIVRVDGSQPVAAICASLAIVNDSTLLSSGEGAGRRQA